MKDFMYIGCSPLCEECVQVGEYDYVSSMLLELILFKRMLQDRWPKADLRIIWESHEFGRYGEVVVYYDDEKQEEQDLACEVEGELPDYWGYWDHDAKQWIVQSKSDCLEYYKE